MKRMKKICGVLLATVLLVTMFSSTAFAAISIPKSQTFYLRSKSGTTSYSGFVGISVDGMTKKQKITKSSVKSSNTSVIAPTSMYRNASDSSYQSFENSGYDYSRSSAYSYIDLVAKKPGTATVSFKIGSKTYKTKVTVKNYVNPAATIKIPGVNSGKNIASKFNSQNYASGKQATTVKSPKISIKAASGWKLTNVSISDIKSNQSLSYWSTKGVSSASIPVAFMLKANGQYSYTFTFRNTKNKAELELRYTTGN